MYISAALVDKAVARKLDADANTVGIGLPAASLRTFSKIREAGGSTVFHAVNAHPKAHNALLLQHYTKQESRSELVPGKIVDRVEEELHGSSLVLVPSVVVAQQMLAFGVPMERIVLSPYGVDLDFWSPPSESARRRKATLRLLFVGQIGCRKGVPFLLDAARNLGRSVQVDMYGPLVNAQVVSGLPDNVIYHGTASRNIIREAMHKSDVFVLPTVEDACALVIAEAASTGLPVVTTRENGASSLLPTSILYPVESGDSKDLTKVLSSFSTLSLSARLESAKQLREGSEIADWSTYAATTIDRLNDRLSNR